MARCSSPWRVFPPSAQGKPRLPWPQVSGPSFLAANLSFFFPGPSFFFPSPSFLFPGPK